jgi:hypothetical protein
MRLPVLTLSQHTGREPIAKAAKENTTFLRLKNSLLAEAKITHSNKTWYPEFS